MGFFENIVQKKAELNSVFKHTFVYNGDKKITRINPLCDCIKYSIKDSNYTFWFKVKSGSTKIVVISYADDTKDFLEMKAIV